VPFRLTKAGRQIARSGRRKLRGMIEIRNSAEATSTPVKLRISR
jgi:hypothetical protein